MEADYINLISLKLFRFDFIRVRAARVETVTILDLSSKRVTIGNLYFLVLSPNLLVLENISNLIRVENMHL